jgi:hypothetical protein
VYKNFLCGKIFNFVVSESYFIFKMSLAKRVRAETFGEFQPCRALTAALHFVKVVILSSQALLPFGPCVLEVDA